MHTPDPAENTSRPDSPDEITVAEFSGIASLGSGGLLLLDCREPEEHAIARIEGAILIPMREIPERLAELEPWREGRIVVHCHHGIRSLRVVEWLRRRGFAGAQSLRGGIDAWSIEIDPSVPRY